MNFLASIKESIITNNLIKPGDTIVVGVSGGADSIALFEALDLLKNEWGLKLIVCHVNHGLRKSADIDQHFVEKLCRKKDVICKSIKISLQKNCGNSLEQAARDKRFSALVKIAKQYKADSIALGHHQNDLSETVLMRIIRGSGLQGLQAILPKRTINTVIFIRPLINQTRADIEKFLSIQKLSYRKDPTNTNQKFLRNKIRHTLLNCLSTKYNPNIREVLARLAETSALDYEFLSLAADSAFKKVVSQKSAKQVSVNIKKLKTLHPALQRMIFRQAIAGLIGNTRRITLDHIRCIENLVNNQTNLPGQTNQLPFGITVSKMKNSLILKK